MHRLVFFGDSDSAVSSLLLDEVLELSSKRCDFVVAAVCDTSPSHPKNGHVLAVRQWLAFHMRRCFNPRLRSPEETLIFPRFRHLCDRTRVPLIRSESGDINEPQFVRKIADEFSPDWALSCYCSQILSPHLLSVFTFPVNYHNGRLPNYRGLRATAWSLYHKEESSGFTFHFMTERIDNGNILLSESIPVEPGTSYRVLEVKKALRARSALDQVLDMLIRGERGVKPEGKGAYFSRTDWHKLVSIRNPETLEASELLRRLRCFEILEIEIGGKIYPVTELVERTRPTRLSLRTQDGHVLKPTRFLYLPYFLFRVYAEVAGLTQWMRRVFGHATR